MCLQVSLDRVVLGCKESLHTSAVAVNWSRSHLAYLSWETKISESRDNPRRQEYQMRKVFWFWYSTHQYKQILFWTSLTYLFHWRWNITQAGWDITPSILKHFPLVGVCNKSVPRGHSCYIQFLKKMGEIKKQPKVCVERVLVWNRRGRKPYSRLRWGVWVWFT